MLEDVLSFLRWQVDFPRSQTNRSQRPLGERSTQRSSADTKRACQFLELRHASDPGLSVDEWNNIGHSWSESVNSSVSSSNANWSLIRPDALFIAMRSGSETTKIFVPPLVTASHALSTTVA